MAAREICVPDGWVNYSRPSDPLQGPELRLAGSAILDDWQVHNHAQLATYVVQCLALISPITLRTSWAGDESLPADADEMRTIALETLRDPAFFFAEHEEILVYRELAAASEMARDGQ